MRERNKRVETCTEERRESEREANDNTVILISNKEDREIADRQQIIERFFKPSIYYFAVRLAHEHPLPNNASFDHLIVSRTLDFIESGHEQILSFFFSQGIGDDDLCDYQLHCVLSKTGEVIQITEERYTRVGSRLVAIPTYYRNGRTDGVEMENAVSLADHFLSLLTEGVEVITLPEDHRLLQPVQILASFDR